MKNLTFNVQKFDIQTESDKSFLKVKFWGIAEGLCRNNVIFTLDGMKKAKPTLRNKPVLGAFNKNKDAFDGHNDLGIKKDEENGEYFVDYDYSMFEGLAEKPIGVIPSESNIQIEEYEGNNWLTFDALIWTNYAYKAVKLLKKLGKEKISVEISLTDYEEDDEGVITAKEFIFDGVTVIGVEEGIEGAHLKVGEFSKTERFTNFRQALSFAYKNEREEGDDKMKFDFKGMSLNTFRDKVWKVLGEYKYERKYKDYDGVERSYECFKYWLYDIFPDNNYIILQDEENEKLLQVPFTINDEREVVLDFLKTVVVELEVAEVSYKTKFSFQARPVNQEDADKALRKNIKNGKGENKMDLKFLEKFVEKDFTPICKLDKFVLFTKKDEEGKVYKLEFESIDKCEEEKFEEVVVQMSLLETKEENSVEMVEKTIFEEMKVELESKKTELEAKLEEEKEVCVKLEEEVKSLKETLSNHEHEQFKLDARKFIEKFGDKFDEEKDVFIKETFKKCESKEIDSIKSLKSFVGELLVEKSIKDEKIQAAQFGLIKPKENNINNNKSTGSALDRL